MEYLIQQVLKQNNLTGINGVNYSLQDDGEGVYIDKWDYEIPKPIFTQDQIDSGKLQEAKISKINEVKNACEIFRTLPLTVDGQTYKATDTAKLKFWSLVNGAATSDYPIIWLENDDVSFVSLSKIQATALYDAFEAQDRSAYQQRGNYISQINACTTLEEVEAIIIDFK